MKPIHMSLTLACSAPASLAPAPLPTHQAPSYLRPLYHSSPRLAYIPSTTGSLTSSLLKHLSQCPTLVTPVYATIPLPSPYQRSQDSLPYMLLPKKLHTYLCYSCLWFCLPLPSSPCTLRKGFLFSPTCLVPRAQHGPLWAINKHVFSKWSV